jgi:hypothetical protein
LTFSRRSSQVAFSSTRIEPVSSRVRPVRASTLTRAIGELGRVAKTLYLLCYLDDETYRRRILTQLNRGESRPGVSPSMLYKHARFPKPQASITDTTKLGTLEGLVPDSVGLGTSHRRLWYL